MKWARNKINIAQKHTKFYFQQRCQNNEQSNDEKKT